MDFYLNKVSCTTRWR